MLCCSVLVAGTWVEATATFAVGGVEPGLAWIYRAEVSDLARDTVFTTSMAFLGVDWGPGQAGCRRSHGSRMGHDPDRLSRRRRCRSGTHGGGARLPCPALAHHL